MSNPFDGYHYGGDYVNFDDEEIPVENTQSPPKVNQTTPMSSRGSSGGGIFIQGRGRETTSNTEEEGDGNEDLMKNRSADIYKHYDVWKGTHKGKFSDWAKCKYCGTNIGNKTIHGTTSMRNHYTRCKKKPAVTEETRGTQTQISQATNIRGTKKVRIFHFDQKRMKERLARLLAKTELPLCIIEDDELIEFVQEELQPSCLKISRKTIRGEIINQFQISKKDLIQNIYDLKGVLSITSDLWTGVNKNGYICVTSHYIDEYWLMNKRIIVFKKLECPHTHEQIYASLIHVINDYNARDKIFGITFDNAAVNTRVVKSLIEVLNPPFEGKFFHNRCVCHIINLIVKAGMKEISDNIHNVRQVVIWIDSSPARQQNFNNYCSLFDVTPRRFRFDVDHRWNSTYIMLKSVQGYETCILNFCRSNIPTCDLTENDFIIANSFVDFLQVFFQATEECSGVYYPTTSIVLKHLYNISATFKKYREHYVFKEICEKMEEKFIKYWKEVPFAFILGSIMDPRIRLQGVEFILQGISNNLLTPLSTDINEIRSFLNTMFIEYQRKYGANNIADSSNPGSSSNLSSDMFSFALLSQHQVGCSSTAIAPSNNLSELHRYLSLPILSVLSHEQIEKLDILTWWRVNEPTYPIVAKMARDLLSTPVSTVASEAAFSAGGRVLDDRRVNLKEDILEASICLKDWIIALRRKQNLLDPIERLFRKFNLDSDDE